MNKLRLKKWVKVVLTIITILVSIKIYTEIGQIQINLLSSINYQVTVVLAWIWLLMGQIMVYMKLWERNW